MEKQATIRSKYIDKTSTIVLLLLGGVKTEALKTWYDISDQEIAEAQKKIQRLGLGGGKT